MGLMKSTMKAIIPNVCIVELWSLGNVHVKFMILHYLAQLLRSDKTSTTLLELTRSPRFAYLGSLVMYLIAYLS